MWLSALIVLAFVVHFALVLIHQFGRDTLPKSVYTLSNRYVVPWFYQNYMMFAPDPIDHMHTFVYRVKSEEGWSKWHDPGFKFLQQHWHNRLGWSSDYYDLLYGIADGLIDGAHQAGALEKNPAGWFEVQSFQNAEKFIRNAHRNDTSNLVAFEVGILTSLRRVTEGDNLRRSTTFLSYPVKKWKHER